MEAETEDRAVGQTTAIHVHWETTMRTIYIDKSPEAKKLFELFDLDYGDVDVVEGTAQKYKIAETGAPNVKMGTDW